MKDKRDAKDPDHIQGGHFLKEMHSFSRGRRDKFCIGTFDCQVRFAESRKGLRPFDSIAYYVYTMNLRQVLRMTRREEFKCLLQYIIRRSWSL